MLHGHAAPCRSSAGLTGRSAAAALRGHVSRVAVVTRAGLLDFFNPGAPKAGGAKRGRAQEIVDELLELTEGTDGGIKASNAVKDEVEQLVDELEAYCPKAPLRSELIFGEWEVVFASKPQTAGGPFRSGLGRAVFPGQRATQVIAPPNLCTNQVSYKALGFVPGAARQEGEIEPIDERTFQLTFPGLDGKRVGGPPRRVIQTAFLDERVRVARALPAEEGGEGSFYVFKRVAEAEEAESDEEEAEEEEEAPAPAPRRAPAFGTQIFQRKGGMATQAERAYEKSGGGRTAAQQARPAPTRGGTAVKSAASGTVRRSAEDAAAARAAAKAAAEEQRQAAREQAAAAKEAAEERRREAAAAAAAEREEAAARKAAAREQYDELAAAAAEAASEARDAVAALKAGEREAAALLRQAGPARGAMERARAAEQGASRQFAEAQQEEVVAQKAVLAAQSAVNTLQLQLRQAAALVGPRVK